MDIKLLFQILGVTSIIVTGASWLLNKLAEQFFANQSESFKIKLAHEATIKAQEHQIKFNRIYEKRANAIIEIFKYLAFTTTDLKNALVAETYEAVEAQLRNCIANYSTAHDLIDHNRILITFEQADLLTQAANMAYDVCWEFTGTLLKDRVGMVPLSETKKSELQKKLEKFRQFVIGTIAEEFRSILSA